MIDRMSGETAVESFQPDRFHESERLLIGMLRSECFTHGRITFDHFMSIAQYHPDAGYYATREARVGYTGDFLTGPETHPIFGATLARQMVECWERLDRPDPFTIREIGAGAGTLASEILTALRNDAPEVFAVARYEIADVTMTRMILALERLKQDGFEHKAFGIADGYPADVMLANELLDAFPFHRLIFQSGELREIYTVYRDGWFADQIGPLSNPALAEFVAGLPLADGQRLEVSPHAAAFAQTIWPQIRRGYAFLIDYGYPAHELYLPDDRYDGTLRTYYQHTVSDDPYRRIGRQDITAHVDFTAIARAAEESGCTVLGLTSQAFFFAGLGIEELLVRLQTTATDAADYLNARETIMHLMDPSALGRFRVLVLGKNVSAEPPLRGLSFSLR